MIIRGGAISAPLFIILITLTMMATTPVVCSGSEKKAKKHVSSPTPTPTVSVTDANLQDRFESGIVHLKKGQPREALSAFNAVYHYVNDNLAVMKCIKDYYEKDLDSKGLKQTQKEDIYTKLQRLNTLSGQYTTVKMESAYYLGAIFAKREDGEQARRYLLEVCQSAPFSLEPNSLWMKSKNLLLSLSDLDGEF